jgi:hypothetical protein
MMFSWQAPVFLTICLATSAGANHYYHQTTGYPIGGGPHHNPSGVDPDPFDTCGLGGCFDDVKLNYQLGQYVQNTTVNYDNRPISIISQDNETVTFEIAHQWGDICLDDFFVQYHQPLNGLAVCHNEDDFEGGCMRITAGCTTDNFAAPLSVVTLTAVDRKIWPGKDVLTTEDEPTPPACCDYDAAPDHHTVQYIFTVYCIPNLCDPGPACSCGDKSIDVDGDGFVAGAGWIYLDADETYVNPDVVGIASFPCETKAHFDFHAKDDNGVPGGSTNFVIDGNDFHFHSATTTGAAYNFLEVPDGTHARFWGTGHLSTALNPNNAAAGDIFSFMVAVQDFGEPGGHDTWRIRIWETATEILVFDTNMAAPLQDDTTTDDRFSGTELGEIRQIGGGNIQIHKSMTGRHIMLESDENCVCAPSPPDVGGGAFVTGGGWIYLTNAIRNTTGTPELLNGNKANFGFHANFMETLMEPYGDIDFDYAGDVFFFHSATGGNSEYNFLEIPSPSEARWMGKGTLTLDARLMLGVAADIVYGFMVAVQDFGEPGAADTWRLRIWNPADGDLGWEGSNPVVPAKYVFDTNPEFPTEHDSEYRFLGTNLGERDSNTLGGGNVQIDWTEQY